MDFMKVFDQTVREIKREVNLKVLKVPEMEQKVLDATDNEPWGPHGSDMAEIAKATKKFSECQMVMNVLWTRLGETGKDWRYVYKALAVIEYLVSHGSERAVDDIIEHTFQISSLTSFEYVEPSGKDSGMNVRKKAETIVALLNNKDKIQEVRNKAAANQNKYVGLSSTGITYKSGSATSSSYSGGSYQSSDRYGGMGGTGSGDRFRDSYKDRDQHDEDKYEKKSSRSRRESRESSSKKNYGSRKDQDDISSDKYNSEPSQAASVPSDDYEDDFDPRGTSTTKAPGGNSNQVDLFGDSLIGDLMDASTPVPENKFGMTNGSSEVDLFADANFVSAPPQADAGAFADATFVSAPSLAETGGFADATFVSAPSHSGTGGSSQSGVDLFASQPTISQSASPPVDLFSDPVPVMQPQTKSTSPAPTNTNLVDPFAAVPLNSFDGSDFLGGFTSHSGSTSSEPSQSMANDSSHSTLDGKSSADSKTTPKKDSFQVKSGIWADSLSRGLIDLNITGPKKVNLAGVGIVGGLNDGSDEREKGPPTSFYMGTAMGSGTGLGKSGYQGAGDDDFFSSLSGGQQYPYGGFQK